MIRTIITPNKKTISFDIPQSYVGKEIEVIAFTKNEGFDDLRLENKKTSFNVLHVEGNGFRFDRDEANDR